MCAGVGLVIVRPAASSAVVNKKPSAQSTLEGFPITEHTGRLCLHRWAVCGKGFKALSEPAQHSCL